MRYDDRVNLADRLDRMPELSQEVTWRTMGSKKKYDRLKVEREIILQWKGMGHYFRIDDPKQVVRNQHTNEYERTQLHQVIAKCEECGEKYAEGTATFVYLAAERSENESHPVPYKIFHVLRSKKKHADISDEIKRLEQILAGQPL